MLRRPDLSFLRPVIQPMRVGGGGIGGRERESGMRRAVGGVGGGDECGGCTDGGDAAAESVRGGVVADPRADRLEIL